MAYYKRMFGNETSGAERLREDDSLVYARRIRDMKDKVFIGDRFNQHLKPKDSTTLGMKDTIRKFVVEEIYENFIVARAIKGGFSMAFTYQELLEGDIQFSERSVG